MGSVAAAKAKKKHWVKKRGFTPVTLRCAYCEEEFTEMPGRMMRRLRQMAEHSGGTQLYCSKQCARHARTDRAGCTAIFKRRAGWSDEKWFWERKLVGLGLGMDRGRRNWLQYGWEPLTSISKVPESKE